MKLFELFSTYYPWKMVSQSKHHAVYTFVTDGGKNYRVLLQETQPEEWDLSFIQVEAQHQDRGHGITGTRDAFKVFSTVMAIFERFIKYVNVEKLTFEAKGGSRQSLYDRMIDMFADEFGFDLEGTSVQSGVKTYTLVQR